MNNHGEGKNILGYFWQQGKKKPPVGAVGFRAVFSRVKVSVLPGLVL